MSLLLLQELKKFVSHATDHLHFGDLEEKLKIHLGWLPIRGVGISGKPIPPMDDSDFPYLIIRLMDGEDQTENGTTQVRMILGIKTESQDGYMEVYHLIEALRQALLRTEIIGGKYELQRPIKWSIPEDQPYPEWIGEFRTTWTTPAILREVDDFE